VVDSVRAQSTVPNQRNGRDPSWHGENHARYGDDAGRYGDDTGRQGDDFNRYGNPAGPLGDAAGGPGWIEGRYVEYGGRQAEYGGRQAGHGERHAGYGSRYSGAAAGRDNRYGQEPEDGHPRHGGVRVKPHVDPPARWDRWVVRLWQSTLVIPTVMPLLTPLYNRVEPQWWGLPFFYWYQLACVLLAIVMITLVYQVTKGRD
jgi:uncharacterized membrane protein YhdT